MKTKFSLFILVFSLLLIPWSIGDYGDTVTAKKIDDETIGYYQINTCKISFSEVVFKNINNEADIKYNINSYSDINCFGKITGLDFIDNKYVVSVGTNILINLLLQSTLWFSVMLFIKNTDRERVNGIKPLTYFLIPLIFTFQFIGEGDFYGKTSKNFSNTLSTENYFILCLFIIFLLVTIFTDQIFLGRTRYLINYIPFIFLFIGTFDSVNLNIYLIIFSILGFENLLNGRVETKYIISYSIVSIIWILNHESRRVLFDVDKIRGFINSSQTYESIIFWIIVIFFFVIGLYYFIKDNLVHIEIEKLTNNFLISGAIVSLAGLAGARFSLMNTLNYYFFGQNKLGMKTLDSIAGNTWRGYSASAESIGEFYFYGLLFFIIVYFNKNLRFHRYHILSVILILYGAFKANNVASLVSFVLLVSLFITYKKQVSTKKIIISLLLTLLGVGIFYVSEMNYQYSSEKLLLEAYKNNDSYIEDQLFEKYVEESNFLMLKNNYNFSSSVKVFSNLYITDRNIPFAPNIVGVISFVSEIINRTEKWGIFLAKYNPSYLDVFFGYGPMQFADYYEGGKLKQVEGLVLPHSSFLDVIIFTGFLGVLILIFLLIKNLYSQRINEAFFLFIFLIINFIKSDSILYISSITLFIFTSILYSNNKVNIYE